MPCSPICPASDALCIAGFKGYRPCRRPLECPWRHSSETLERQQDSSPRHAKHKPEKLCERCLYQWQMSLGGTVPKHSNTSRIRAQGMQNTSQKNSPNVTFGIHKKQQFYRPWDASPASKTIGKCPLEAQFRNTWTPAGFQPKACKTQARKTLRTLPLESIKNNYSIAREMPLQLAKPLANVPWRHSSETFERQQDSSPRHAKHKPEKLCERYLYQWQMSLGGTVPKHSNTSRIRAQGMQNTSQKNSPNVTFGIHKKQQFYRPWDASPASKTIGKCHAKHKPEKLCERYLYQWQMSVGGTVPKHSNTSRIRAQGMQNTSQKNSANVTFGIHKKQQFYRPWDASPASKTIGKCPLEAQFRNTWTPAGFQPKACKTQARKTLRTLPLESIKNNYSIAREMPLQLAKPLANVPWRHSSETFERQQDSSPRHAKHKPEKLCERYLYQWQMSLGGTVPKHSNTSRIRAQGMQNTSQKNSPNVTFGIHKKQQFYRPWDASPASKTIGKCHAKHKPEKLCERYLYQWQMSVGGTVPKHSNTSRIRAQGMQNTSQKNSPNVTFGTHKTTILPPVRCLSS